MSSLCGMLQYYTSRNKKTLVLRNPMQLKTTSTYVFWGKRMLLIKRSPQDKNLPCYWEAPAGHVDCVCPYGDSITARQEALRELREETGIILKPCALRFLPAESSNTHSAFSVHLRSPFKPKVRLSFEHTNALWVHPKLARRFKLLRPEVRKFIEDKLDDQ